MDAALEDFLLSGPVFDAPTAIETLMTLFLKRFEKSDELTMKILSAAVDANRESPKYLPQLSRKMESIRGKSAPPGGGK